MDAISKFLSGKKKLLVWIVSSIFLPIGLITSEHWFFITTAYLGAEGAADFITRRIAAKAKVEADKNVNPEN